MVDCSSFMHLGGHVSSPRLRAYSPNELERIWRNLIARIEDGRVKTVPQVMDELQRNDRRSFDRLQPFRKTLTVPNAGRVNAVRLLLTAFPDLVRADALSDPADPWLIVAAADHNAVVVTNEVPSAERRRPGPPRIPDVCAAHHIEWISVVTFVNRKGLAKSAAGSTSAPTS
jgi:Domain of unknown function (DUF4411)